MALPRAKLPAPLAMVARPRSKPLFTCPIAAERAIQPAAAHPTENTSGLGFRVRGWGPREKPSAGVLGLGLGEEGGPNLRRWAITNNYKGTNGLTPGAWVKQFETY